ncbi:MAG: hypothetical protein WCA12_18405 [Burkholderiales bacterium]
MAQAWLGRACRSRRESEIDTEHQRVADRAPTARNIGQSRRAAGTAGNLATHPHLAALAVEHDATLAAFDRDFDRSDGLRFERLRA